MRNIARFFLARLRMAGRRIPFPNRQTSIATGRKRCENDQMTEVDVGNTLRDQIPLVSVVAMDAGRRCQ
jgi:hypothetical protein